MKEVLGKALKLNSASKHKALCCFLDNSSEYLKAVDLSVISEYERKVLFINLYRDFENQWNENLWMLYPYFPEVIQTAISPFLEEGKTITVKFSTFYYRCRFLAVEEEL